MVSENELHRMMVEVEKYLGTMAHADGRTFTNEEKFVDARGNLLGVHRANYITGDESEAQLRGAINDFNTVCSGVPEFDGLTVDPDSYFKSCEDQRKRKASL